jgi:nucleotide-binding universal stress UspA family protein
MKILLCIDGEAHTEKAIDYALELASATGWNLSVLHVVDGFLLEKRITHELYATGREEFREYVRGELEKMAREVMRSFNEKARARGVSYAQRLRWGEPVKEVLKEIEEEKYDLVILGSRAKSRLAQLKSRNLPLKVYKNSKTSVLVVR